MNLRIIFKGLIGSVWLPCVLLARGGSVEFVTNGTERDYAARFRSSYHLGEHFSQSSLETMIKFLHRVPAQDVVSADELATLKNNIADVVIEQKGLAPRLLDEFITMYAEPSQGFIWRNYIVQKIPFICVNLEDQKRIARALNFLWSVARDPIAGYTCEAFLGLDRICSARPDRVTSFEMRREALACLESGRTSPEVKGIVLQILARHDGVTARQKALAYLSGESSVMLRASSLAALGRIGGSEDIAIVEAHTLSSDIRLGEAARAALKRLQSAQNP